MFLLTMQQVVVNYTAFVIPQPRRWVLAPIFDDHPEIFRSIMQDNV